MATVGSIVPALFLNEARVRIEHQHLTFERCYFYSIKIQSIQKIWKPKQTPAVTVFLLNFRNVTCVPLDTFVELLLYPPNKPPFISLLQIPINSYNI